jgi:PE-PPE domain
VVTFPEASRTLCSTLYPNDERGRRNPTVSSFLIVSLCDRLRMRKSARAIALVFLALLTSVVLGLTSAFMAALAVGATALIVPGTGTHNILTVTGYKENARDRFIAPADPSCTQANGCVLIGIDYPASFWPIPLPGWCPGLTCDTWNQSVGTGVTNLHTELMNQLANPTPANQQIVLFGYSQGGAVVSHEMYNLANLPQATKDRIHVVTIGNIENPQGLWSRLSFLPTIPILNVTFGPQLPTNIGITSTNYVFEYDPVGDAPLYWGNPLAMLNALAAFQYVHGEYLVPNSNAPRDMLPYGYTPATLATAIQNAPKRTFQDGTFVLIPQQGTLPIMQPFVNLAAATGLSAFVQPIVDLISPTLKVLIDLAYDRTANPGIPRNLSILPFNPFLNPVQLAVDLVGAVIKGIIDALTPGPAPFASLAPAPDSTTTDVSPLAARSAAAPLEAATVDASTTAAAADEPVSESEETPAPRLQLVSEEATPSEAEVVEDEPATADMSVEAEDETTPSVEEPVVTKPEVDEETDVSETTTSETTTSETTTSETTTSETTTSETTADEDEKDDVKKNDVKKDADKKNDVKKIDVKKNDVKKNDVKKDADSSDGADSEKAAA